MIIAGMAKAGAAASAVATAATSSVGAGLLAGGTAISAVGAIQQGNAQQSMANYQAGLAERRADEERALGIRKSQELRRRGRMAISRARAVGAASGGGIDYEGIADLDAETEIRAMGAIWEGDAKSDELRQDARVRRASGRQARSASYFNAASTILGGGDTLMYKYGA